MAYVKVRHGTTAVPVPVVSLPLVDTNLSMFVTSVPTSTSDGAQGHKLDVLRSPNLIHARHDGARHSRGVQLSTANHARSHTSLVPLVEGANDARQAERRTPCSVQQSAQLQISLPSVSLKLLSLALHQRIFTDALALSLYSQLFRLRQDMDATAHCFLPE